MILSESNRDQGLPDLLNYAHFIQDGIIINKDGAFLVAYQFRAPDINSATPGELEALTNIINKTANLLDDGWMLHVDELRIPSTNYPEVNYFPCEVARLIDDERKSLYASEGAHYENIQYLTFVWKFPLPIVKTTRHWFVEGLEDKEKNDAQVRWLPSARQIFLDS